MSKSAKWLNQNSKDNLSHLNFIEHQHICALCGSNVHIQLSEVDKINHEVVEQASCTQCKIKTREKKHTLQ